ncbi:protein phosphatase 2C domain-containing protein [[Actinomadura] parvosata]|uniref:protein phosphatase 2C domain-containing protein n=1 Tax=[Actinomadura] parvosata TaxID=1955412 RepID=UPI0009AC982D|nr:protein phosphatase 2C domain-containing protein [Nonomuraea sp. ATCC 55076]
MAIIGPRILAVLDGLTERTESGCVHGVSWYVAHLAGAIVAHANHDPVETLKAAIAHTAHLHRESCDLSHIGTPSAAVGIVQLDEEFLQYLVLGDVTVVIDSGNSERVIFDDRIERATKEFRREVDSLTANSPKKEEALIRMKHAELAVRNTEGGYWISAAIPDVANHALVGKVPLSEIKSVSMLTDGAARAVDTFGLGEWREIIDLLSTEGPNALIRRVRTAEHSDPVARKWPRNKVSDDATVIICDLTA